MTFRAQPGLFRLQPLMSQFHQPVEGCVLLAPLFRFLRPLRLPGDVARGLLPDVFLGENRRTGDVFPLRRMPFAVAVYMPAVHQRLFLLHLFQRDGLPGCGRVIHLRRRRLGRGHRSQQLHQHRPHGGADRGRAGHRRKLRRVHLRGIVREELLHLFVGEFSSFGGERFRVFGGDVHHRRGRGLQRGRASVRRRAEAMLLQGEEEVIHGLADRRHVVAPRIRTGLKYREAVAFVILTGD